MKRKTIISAIAIMLCIVTLCCIYISAKNSKKIPELSVIAQMEEAKVNEVIVGYYRNQLIEVWGEPNLSQDNRDTWQLDNNMTLVVSTNNKGKVVVCGILQ